MPQITPRGIIHRAAREAGVDVKARHDSALINLGTTPFVLLAHALSLIDFCGLGAGHRHLRLTPAPENKLSDSNKVHSTKSAGQVFRHTSSVMTAALSKKPR